MFSSEEAGEMPLMVSLFYAIRDIIFNHLSLLISSKEPFKIYRNCKKVGAGSQDSPVIQHRGVNKPSQSLKYIPESQLNFQLNAELTLPIIIIVAIMRS